MSAVLQSHEVLRPMTGQDLDAVMQIEQETYHFPWTRGIFQDCLRVGYGCWVYEVADKVQAYAVMSNGAGEAHILTLVVKKSARGCGIGKLMLRFMLDQARRYAVETVLLEVRPSNPVAIALYRNHGFNELGLRPNYYPSEDGREDALIMALSFADEQYEFLT